MKKKDCVHDQGGAADRISILAPVSADFTTILPTKRSQKIQNSEGLQWKISKEQISVILA